MRNFSTVCVMLAVVVSPSLAWGPEGHRVIADIARSHLSADAKTQVRQLLGNDDLAAVANWADEIKSERPETADWHFVDIPMNASGFYEPRDCFHPNPRRFYSDRDHHNCVVDRIEMFQQILADKKATRENRIEGLKFLVHFVGDVHQPLHGTGEARGGDEIHVIEFGSSECGSRPCNLHSAWDIGLIEHCGRNESSYDQELEKAIVREHLSARVSGNPEDWANESFKLAKQVWVTDGGAVDQAYYVKNIHIVDEQLGLAGLRLARMLNRALGLH